MGREAAIGRVGYAKLQRELKPASLAGAALHTDVSSHKLDQSRADGQPQTRAAEPTRHRVIELFEGLKQSILLFRRNPNACIRDGNLQLQSIARTGLGGNSDQQPSLANRNAALPSCHSITGFEPSRSC